MSWEKYLKNPIQKIDETVKIRVKLPHVNKKDSAPIQFKFLNFKKGERPNNRR